MTMSEAIRTYNMSGGYFFSPDTMKFWESKIETELINDEYFVTSEPDMYGRSRRCTVRRFTKGYTEVETVGGFRQYGSVRMAVRDIENILRGVVK